VQRVTPCPRRAHSCLLIESYFCFNKVRINNRALLKKGRPGEGGEEERRVGQFAGDKRAQLNFKSRYKSSVHFSLRLFAIPFWCNSERHLHSSVSIHARRGRSRIRYTMQLQKLIGITYHLHDRCVADVSGDGKSRSDFRRLIEWRRAKNIDRNPGWAGT